MPSALPETVHVPAHDERQPHPMGPAPHVLATHCSDNVPPIASVQMVPAGQVRPTRVLVQAMLVQGLEWTSKVPSGWQRATVRPMPPQSS
jgi:hypothetical protein